MAVCRVLQLLTQCLSVVLKYYILGRLADVPRMIAPQMAVPLDKNSLALRPRCGVADDSEVPYVCVVSLFF